MNSPCPHETEWLKHFSASGNIQCQNCGEVFVPRRQVGREFAALQRNLHGALGGSGLLMECSRADRMDKNADSLDKSALPVI